MTPRDSAYLAALVRAHLLAAEDSHEEGALREVIGAALDRHDLDLDALDDLQERESARLREEGIL